jgi:hypothetical protein
MGEYSILHCRMACLRSDMLEMLDSVSYLSTQQLIQQEILFKHLMPGSLLVMHSRLVGLSERKVLGFNTPRITSIAARQY